MTLRQVAMGVLSHESEFIQSNAVVVVGRAGVLLIDPGIQGSEMACLANDLRELGQPVVAGFSTHPHWDHLLWHAQLGAPPRHATARCAASVREQMSDPEWKAREAEELPPEIADDVPLDLLGLISGLPAGAERIPWDGPQVRIIEHQAHAPGHAALLIEQRGVLVAGDMLSDVLIPMLDLNAAEPVDDYLAALRLLEGVAGDVDVVVPGHGSIGGADQVRARIDRDRAYVEALRGSHGFGDPRIGPSAKPGWEWVSDVHEGQLQGLAQRSERAAAPGETVTGPQAPLPKLSDGRVLLRGAEPRDLPAIEAGIHDPDVIRWIGPQPPSARDVLVRDEAWWAKGSPTLSICELDGTCVGKVWLEVQETDPSTGFVGYWLLPVGRGRGLATSAVRLMSAWAVSELGIANVRIRAAPDNPRSHRVAERSGFRRMAVADQSANGPEDRDVVFALGTSAPA